jgi:hypothetical protein
MPSGQLRPAAGWLAVIRRYLVAVTAGNLLWEIAQLPLYTLWQSGSGREITKAVLHCTIGDVAIASVALLLSLALLGAPEWPETRMGSAITGLVAIGVSYTIYSEYMNAIVQRSWSYTAMMPTLPWLGTGLSPLAQWLLIPPAALWWSAGAFRNPKLHTSDGVSLCMK